LRAAPAPRPRVEMTASVMARVPAANTRCPQSAGWSPVLAVNTRLPANAMERGNVCLVRRRAVPAICCARRNRLASRVAQPVLSALRALTAITGRARIRRLVGNAAPPVTMPVNPDVVRGDPAAARCLVRVQQTMGEIFCKVTACSTARFARTPGHFKAQKVKRLWWLQILTLARSRVQCSLQSILGFSTSACRSGR
jgi:hypothetical protein